MQDIVGSVNKLHGY